MSVKLLFPNKVQSLLLYLIFFIMSGQGLAQKKVIDFDAVKEIPNYGRFRTLEIKGHTGYHLYNGTTLDETVDGGYGAIEARYGWQSTDSTSWQAETGYPSYGVGYYSGFIGDPDILGKPNALFGFINFPLSRSEKRNVWEIGQSLGVTYSLEPYDTENNPTNDAIGAPFAVYFNLSLGAAYRLTRELDVVYGVDFTHFSVGRITTPNHGLNMYGLNLAFRYHYNADQRFVDGDSWSQDLLQARFKRPEKKKNTRLRENSIETYFGFGTVQNLEDQGTANRYFVFSGVLDYRYKFNTMHGITVGLDYFYDESLEMDYPNDQDLIGLHVGYDFMFGKFSLRFQYGAYLEPDKGKDPTYIRGAFRYDITPWLFTQLGIKTRDQTRADWAEFGFGFTPFRF
jgi:hypothetical protein